MASEILPRLFKEGTPQGAMLPFVGFASCVLIAVAVLIGIGRFDLALASAWAAMIVEIVLALWRKTRLKVPFGLVLTLYGPLVILAASWLRSVVS